MDRAHRRPAGAPKAVLVYPLVPGAGCTGCGMAAVAPHLCEHGFTVVRDDLEHRITYLTSGAAAALSHGAPEPLLSARGQGLLRRLLQAHLDARGLGAAPGPVRGAGTRFQGPRVGVPRIH